MSKKREHKFLSFVAVVIILIFVGAIFMALGSGNLYKNTSSNQQSSNQTYKSKAMKFSIEVPLKFEIDEKFTEVHLTNNAKEGITISRVGTNFSNIDGYMNDLAIKNKINRENITKVNINGLNGIYGLIKYPGGHVMGEKTYYIYVENWVYYISTSSEGLFGDLDQIARSFKYTP